jgi:hypothetical protein
MLGGKGENSWLNTLNKQLLTTIFNSHPDVQKFKPTALRMAKA